MKRSSLVLAILSIGGVAFASPTPDKADYVNCLGHAERASQSALFNKPRDIRPGLEGALSCEAGNQALTDDQQQQLALIYKMLRQQVLNPSAIGHAQITMESTRFLGTLP